jgi:hypothetical protein
VESSFPRRETMRDTECNLGVTGAGDLRSVASARSRGYRADRNAMASTASHATITKEATAPAVILAFSFVV